MINLQLTECFRKIDMGDYLVIHDTGAHGFSMGYNYNGQLKLSRATAERRWKRADDSSCRDTEGLFCNI